jgi:hypothetical protein
MHDNGHDIQASTLGLSRSSDDAVVDAVLHALDLAVALARAGNCERARELCASVFFEAQPTIAARADLLRYVLHALLAARGFKLLSRVVLAVSGRSVQVVILPDEAGHVAPPRIWQEPRHTVYALDPRWLCELSPDDSFLRHWCETLTAQKTAGRQHAGATAVQRHLEPV